MFDGGFAARAARRIRQAFLGWSGQLDSNQRPAVPKTAALPGCAIPRSCWEVTSIPRLNRSPQGAKPAPSAAIEQRMGHPIAGRDTVFLGGAGNDLQHP